ncbi:amino acid adenylation domain-containing protein [Streptomyces sp. NPDC050508]|uniref:non-ribosomal peptide synthetase n=1 Tax=Streptomyces sp. NPDC050508 TaxID=3155405 RepID=UPI00343084ED
MNSIRSTGQQDLLNTVADAARRHPGRPAVIDRAGTTTYAHLMARARQWSEDFRARGVRPGDLVALLLPPGRDAIAAALAAFMAGAAYAPIDPAQPARRIGRMLQGCRPALCLSVAGADVDGRPTVAPEQLAGGWADDTTTPLDLADVSPLPDFPTRPADVAYVIHTSGSTGNPKGVQVEHHGVLELIDDFADRAPVPAVHRGAAWSSPDFDASIWEVWPVLTHGGTVVVVPEEDRLDAADYLAFLDRHAIHTAYVPPSFLPDLLARTAADPVFCRELTRLMVGVEPIPLGLLQDLMRHRPGLTVVNAYGTAETTVICAVFTVPRTGGDPLARTPIGTAVKGSRLAVIDGTGAPSADGHGELVAIGGCVARGYLGASGEAAARFFTWPDGERAYRTGDLVSTLPDGNIVFGGRADRQLKVRGYRIEPGEVEAAVHAVMNVQEVVVGARDLPGHGPAVVAYLRPRPGEVPDERAARAALRERLPAYAVPAAFVLVEAVPLTKNGKTDHAALGALPLPGSAAGSSPLGGLPPSGSVAGSSPLGGGATVLDLVIGSWQAVLGAVPVAAGDGFVDIGGTSLSAVRVASRLRELTGRRVSAADVLTTADAGGLAARIEQAPFAEAPAAPAAAKGAVRGPLSPTQLAMWMHETVTDNPELYIENACFELRGPLDAEGLATALEATFAAHPVFGSTVLADGSLPVQQLGVHRIGVRRVSAAEVGGAVRAADTGAVDTASAVDAFVLRESRTGIDLTGGPLTRCLLITVAEDHHVLLFVWHHLVVDAVSFQVFLGDLRSRCADPAFRPEPSPVTACDLNALEIAALDHPATRARAAEAVTRLKGVELLPLAVRRTVIDAGHGPAAGADASGLPVEITFGTPLPAPTAAGRIGTTLPALLSAAFQRAVGETLDLPEFPLGMVTAGRTENNSSRATGCFVNTVLLRADGDPHTAPEPAILAAAGQLAQAVSEQDLPFSAVAAELLRDVIPRPRSFPEICLSMSTAIRLELPGVTCVRRRLRQPQPKFDLALIVEYAEGGLSGELHYRRQLIDDATAGRVVAAFAGQLSALTAGIAPTTAELVR